MREDEYYAPDEPRGDEPGAMPAFSRGDPLSPQLWRWAAEVDAENALYYTSLAHAAERRGCQGDVTYYERLAANCLWHSERALKYAKQGERR